MGAQLHLISSQTAGKVSANRELDVVFVHGLGGDPVRTWRHGKDESTSWPHWLAEEYGERIGVWSFGYPASKFRAQRWIERLKKFMRLPYDEDGGYSMPLPDRARNALHIMVREGIGHRPCIFIVHSLGGLLVKYVLNLAHEEDKSSEEHALITNCKALLFLATPHQGSELASLVANFRVFFPSITIDELRENDSHLRKLFQWYRKHAPQYNIDTRSFYESRATAGVAVVVTPDSADPGTTGNEPVPLDADHLSISRPKIKNNPVVLEAQKLINGQLINDQLHLNTQDLKSEENTANAELAKKLPSNNETLDTVVAALTGLPKDFIATAIPNVHQASEKSLEILDPRFKVKTSYSEGNTSIAFYAKENVQGSMKISGENAKQYLKKFQQFYEHGKDLEIQSDSVEIEIEGSKLLKEVFETPRGNLSIISRKLEATQKLWLVQKDTNLIESFDDIHGVISFGTKTFTFEGFACQKLFKFIYQQSFDENDDKANITMSLCLEQWEGVNIKVLPFFDKLYSLFDKMSKGWLLSLSLEINGDKLLSTNGICVNELEIVLDAASFLHYVACGKSVVQFFNWDILFTSEIAYTSEEHKKISEAAYVVEGKLVYYKDSILSNPTAVLVVNENFQRSLERTDQPSTIKFVISDREEITIFGKQLTIPSKVVTLDGVLPKVNSESGPFKEGDEISVECVPQDNFKCTIAYETWPALPVDRPPAAI
jgi:hypothetical protein